MSHGTVLDSAATCASKGSGETRMTRQKVLVLYLANSALDSAVIGWSLYDGSGATRRMAGDEDSPPYANGLDALRDGWRLFQAGHWATLTQGDQTARIVGGPPNVVDFDALRAINEAGRGLADTAMTLSTVLSWVLAVAMLGLVLDILTQMWRAATIRD